MKTIHAILTGILLLSAPAYATRYALLAGVDNYDPAYISSPLSSCVNDANGMRRCLIADSSRWSGGNITTLTDSAATKTEIRKKLNDLASKKADPGDTVIYFQSSHGGQNSGTDTYLCTYNADYEDEELAADLALFKDGVNVIVLIDACHSGGLFKSTESSSVPIKQVWNFSENVMKYYDSATKNAQTKSASIGWITACNFDELSMAGIGYSLFAKHMIYGFAYGDANTDGVLSFQELFDYSAPRALSENPGQTAQLYNSSVLAATEAAAVVPFDPDLQNAVDQSTLQMYSEPGPGALWFRQTGTKHDGSDAAESGNITDGQSSEFGTRVVGPGTVSYWWRSSSEADFDFLFFFIDDRIVAVISGTSTTWVQNSHPVGPGEHMLRWVYQKDISYSVGDDCGWVDQVVWTPDSGTPSTLIPNAIDNLLLPIKTGGTTPWFRQTSTTFDGVDAAQSGSCTDAQISWFTTELIGPGDLSFQWRASSEEGYDTLSFSLDEMTKARISGNTAWQEQAYTLGTGTHTVGWCYEKDESVLEGSDCGWVDQVVWTGDCDTDGDGLLTSWEISNGLSYTDPSGANGPDGNPDGDSQNNMQEYIAGTIPTDPTSFFQITNTTVQTDPVEGFIIQWPSMAGRSYRVLWAPTLTNTFQLIESNITYSANSYTDTTHTVESQGYYRVEVQMQ